jgi:hypothetical protein
MVMVGANLALPNRPRSLWRFLALWLASYLAPVVVASMLAALIVVAGRITSLVIARYGVFCIWLVLLPAGGACGQWMWARAYLPNALRWTTAIFTAALLGQISVMFVPEATAKAIATVSPLSWLFRFLRATLGGTTAADALTVLPIAICFGVAWAIPPALVIPGARSVRVAWAMAHMVIGAIVVVGAKTLPEQFLLGLFSYPVTSAIALVAVYGLPVLLGWITLSLVGGSIMYWSLRRGSSVAISQVYARFD